MTHRFQFVIEARQYSAEKGSESDVNSVTAPNYLLSYLIDSKWFQIIWHGPLE